jgi:hypothetical protein
MPGAKYTSSASEPLNTQQLFVHKPRSGLLFSFLPPLFRRTGKKASLGLSLQYARIIYVPLCPRVYGRCETTHKGRSEVSSTILYGVCVRAADAEFIVS